jgi:hypothetical protein
MKKLMRSRTRGDCRSIRTVARCNSLLLRANGSPSQLGGRRAPNWDGEYQGARPEGCIEDA